MEIVRRAVLVLALALCTGLPLAAVEVVYLANEGVLIRSGETKILIDALFGDGLDHYPAVPPAMRAQLEQAAPPFDGVDLVLATHEHRDHFDPLAVTRHLAANPDALLVSTPQAIGRLPARAQAQARAILPPTGQIVSIEHGGVSLEVFELDHGPGTDAQNLGFVVEVDGIRILHVGDTELSAEEIARSVGGEGGIDLALLPSWVALDGVGVEQHLAPEGVAVMHLPKADAPAWVFGRHGSYDVLQVRLAAAAPEALVLRRPGQLFRACRSLKTSH